MISALSLDGSVDHFRSLIERRLGLYFDEGKRDFLAEILHARLGKIGEANDEAYLRRLEGTPCHAEWRALSQMLTVPETYFFRHFDQFRAYAEVALPARMAARGGSGRLAVLSLGCASGEEAYSLAIMARETVHDPAWQIEIRGADINPAMIDKALSVRYTDWSLRETSPELQRKWFRRQGRDHVLDPRIRAAVQFEERNLSQDAPDFWRAQAYDVIFCRNMMMYFSPDKARELVARIARALAPGGYLFLGHAETLRGLSHDFHLCHTHQTFYYRKRSADEPAAHPALMLAGGDLPPPLAAVLDDGDAWIAAIQRSAERIQSLAAAPAKAAPRPDAARAWDLGQAFALLRQERFAEALAALRVLPAEAERDVDTLLLKAVLHAHSGQPAEAAQTCERLLAIDEFNAGAWYVLALCREGEGDNRAAIEHNQAAAYLDPGFAMPHLHLGLLWRREGRMADARHELERALVLLQQEDPARLLLFGGGFGRDALLALCRAELDACGGRA